MQLLKSISSCLVPIQIREIICPILIKDEIAAHKIHLQKILPLDYSTAVKQETNSWVTLDNMKP